MEANEELIKLAFDYQPGNIIDCEVEGQPGYKASYENCKCYIYEPGNEASKKEAKRKAYMQDYHKQRSKRVHGSVREAIPFFDGSTAPDAVTQHSSPGVQKGPQAVVDENTTDTFSGGGPFGRSNPLGVGNNPMGDELNNPGTASAY